MTKKKNTDRTHKYKNVSSQLTVVSNLTYVQVPLTKYNANSITVDDLRHILGKKSKSSDSES